MEIERDEIVYKFQVKSGKAIWREKRQTAGRRKQKLP